jgi:hypothetical protein
MSWHRLDELLLGLAFLACGLAGWRQRVHQLELEAAVRALAADVKALGRVVHVERVPSNRPPESWS